MPELTDAQKRKMAKLETTAQAVADGTDAVETTDAVSLSIMLGEGNSVQIGQATYEIAPFPLGKLTLAGKLVAACPDLIVSAALSASPEGEIGTRQTTETLNKLMAQSGAKTSPLAEEMIAFSFQTAAMQVTDEEVVAMTNLTVLALARLHPGITAEAIENDLDLQTFTLILCKILAQNQPLKARF